MNGYAALDFPARSKKKRGFENEKKIRLTLVKSAIGYSKDQKRTVVALGLNKLNSSNELPDNGAVRGMIFKIKHVVRVEEI